MNLLIDTCDFLWFISGDSQLSRKRREAIESSENAVFLSAVSTAEISIKVSINKLTLPEPPETYVPHCRRLHRIAELPLDERAAGLIAALPIHHRDPFDRLLVCQALVCGFTLLSSDPLIHQYQLPLL
jgi:PIN domain nuclease of toxin-antitoxin system